MLPQRPESTQAAQARLAVRDAATEFIRGTTHGWGRRELARWLVCHYSPCLIADALMHPDGGLDGAGAEVRAPDERPVDDAIERVILQARGTVLRLLPELSSLSSESPLTRSMVEKGAILELRDPRSRVSWAPVGRRRMRLALRVTSLFVADALNAPSAYREITLCRECGVLGFSAPVTHDPSCSQARCAASRTRLRVVGRMHARG